MEATTESDAWALWQDAIDLATQQGLPDSTVAMLRKCTADGLDDGVLALSTPARFVQKNVVKNIDLVNECVAQAAFEPIRVEVRLRAQEPPGAEVTEASVTPRSLESWQERPSEPSVLWESTDDSHTEEAKAAQERRRASNPLVEQISDNNSHLTFERFVQGSENLLAYQAALQVAEGENKNYNPLFIFGKSGLGKTHLLRAIQNYVERNDPSRICVYKDSTSFIDDYVQAMKDRESGADAALKANYRDIDVLIIDDIQKMAGAGHTINFFFDLFNHLKDNGKQIVLAADRSPAQLGMGKDHFDERVTSRIDSGFSTSISVPTYELKVRLVNTFVERIVQDSLREHVSTMAATISDENQKYMAEVAGTNIRVIEGFCQSCLIQAARLEVAGEELTREHIQAIAREKWPINRRSVSVEEIQQACERYYDVSHSDLIGNKRNKELMEPRHVSIWLSRELTDLTLADIGKKFGGRTHATVKHSIGWVEETKRKDKNLYDRIEHVREGIANEA